MENKIPEKKATNFARGRTPARKIVLVALALHFFSLFFIYQDADVKDYKPLLWNTGQFVQVGTEVPVQTGMKLKPLGAGVIIILFILFLSKMAVDPFWKKYGYWITIVLVIAFAFGGAVVRTTGGNMSLVSVGLLFIAAFLNSVQLKKEKTLIRKDETKAA